MSDEPPATPRWRAYLQEEPLGAGLAMVLIAAFVGQVLLLTDPGRWGVSAEALRQGRWSTLISHMFIHGGLLHIFFNVSALVSLAPGVTLRLRPSPAKPVAFFGLYLISGLVGALTFVALNPASQAPAVGASGAICGLWGAAARLGPYPGQLTPFFSRPMFQQIRAFTVMNLILIALVWLITGGIGGGAVGGIAWQAHLGGFVTGLVLAGPMLRLFGDRES